jgi:nucleotide-binding universal stress UspA family protein
MFQNILYPTDFSAPSEALAGHVRGLADAFGAKVWLFSVVPSLADFHGASEGYFGPFTDRAILDMEATRKALEADYRGRLERFQKCCFEPAKSQICVRSGGVAESIVDFADELKASLVMMSTRGHGTMRRFLIGSVAAKVLHDTKRPLWTSPHPQELGPFHRYRHIVVAIDYLWWPPELLLRAAEVAEHFHAQLSVVSAVPPAGFAGDEFVQKRYRRMAETLEQRIAALDVEARAHLMEGTPGQVVRQIAEEIEEADLIITGRGHLDESMGHLRTHAYEIIANAPCPVLTL